ncbi:MAG: DUF4199 domain-containing protein [Opitutaceae bacterium]|nr:DUF4199 domain-containing protein [Opitutaceae bacterium]
MNTTFFYGLMLALSNIVLTLIGYFLGYQTEKMMQGKWFGVLPLVAMIAVMGLGIRAAREEAADKSLSYGKGVGTGALIALYGGLIGAIYTYVHLTFINPNFADYVIDMARQQWLAAGLGDSQMETAEKAIRLIYKPAMQAAFVTVFSPLFGLVMALVLSAFLKRKPANPGENAPPVM